MQDQTPHEPITSARQVVDVASDHLASDIVLLDVHEVTSFADFLVIMSAGTLRQMNALAAEIEKDLKQRGTRLYHLEGTAESGWVLLDFGDVVVHVFSEEHRDFYRLEEVWNRARQLVRIQ